MTLLLVDHLLYASLLTCSLESSSKLLPALQMSTYQASGLSENTSAAGAMFNKSVSNLRLSPMDRPRLVFQASEPAAVSVRAPPEHVTTTSLCPTFRTGNNGCPEPNPAKLRLLAGFDLQTSTSPNSNYRTKLTQSE